MRTIKTDWLLYIIYMSIYDMPGAVLLSTWQGLFHLILTKLYKVGTMTISVEHMKKLRLLEIDKWWRQDLTQICLTLKFLLSINSQKAPAHSQIWPCWLFFQRNSIKAQPHSFVNILFTTAFMLGQQSCTVVTDILSPAMPNEFTIWPFADSLLTPVLMKHYAICMYFLPTV